MKTALITGINGMDGSHLADFLLEKGYEVFGIERRSSTKNRTNTAHLQNHNHFHFITADLTDQNSLYRALKKSNPDEVYNLAAQSFVGASWDIPIQTSLVNGLGVVNFLEAIREYEQDTERKVKFYQASTSEMFGKNGGGYANEETPFYPRSPYGVAKLYAYWMVKNYRESHGLFACSGILFNHESERRGIEFVTRKITDAVARIKLGLQDTISLGNIEAKRDWGYAPDYVEGMWLMLQQDEPDDYVLATEESHSIKDFLKIAFDEVGINNWDEYIVIDPRFYRPAEVDVLIGDSSKAKDKLGWKCKTSFEELVRLMVRNDLKLLGE
jgi:GDPmannose 4,6-dehydratase